MARLPTRSVSKPWGKAELPPPFPTASDDGPIGEIWFEPTPQLPDMLVKYIFTSEKLSVQVHPSDAQTQALGLGRQGKEECWLVLDADPGAVLGIGFTSPLSRAALRAAALDGSIESLMAWHPVKAGDFFYIPANTVHAIGAGISLIEVQQTSDITYRLYDYGRPRELHLDDALAVAQLGPYDDKWRQRLPHTGAAQLVEGPCFRLDRTWAIPDQHILERYAGPMLVVPIDEPISISGNIILPGQVGFAEDVAMLSFATQGHCLICQTTSS